MREATSNIVRAGLGGGGDTWLLASVESSYNLLYYFQQRGGGWGWLGWAGSAVGWAGFGSFQDGRAADMWGTLQKQIGDFAIESVKGLGANNVLTEF